jgi:hypothetical protein
MSESSRCVSSAPVHQRKAPQRQRFPKRTTAIVVFGLVLGVIHGPVNAQSVWQRLKKGAEEAAKKADTPAKPGAQPAAVPPAIQLPASTARVEAVVLAQAENGLQFHVSPRGGHLAAVTQRGSRFVVIHEGVEGPRFDEILADDARNKVFFSDDGQRYSYVGRVGQEYVVMVDGKEQMRLPAATTKWYRNEGARFPDFTPGGKHTFFSVHSTQVYATQLFFDGQPVVTNSRTISEPVLSPDGDHYAVVAGTSRDKEWGLIVDGRPAGYQGMEPQFTADGHLFTKIALPGGPGIAVLLDGKPFFRAQDARLYIPPIGHNVVSVIVRQVMGDPNGLFLVVNGKKVEGSEATRIDNVWFSPDGRHYAADCVTPSGTHFIIADGKKGEEYRALMDLRKTPTGARRLFEFSTDSTRTAYIAHSGDKEFAVIDGVESEGYPFISSFSFGGGGKRIAFIGRGANTRDRWIVVDGKATQRNFAFDDLAFSPDGSRYAYTFHDLAGVITRRAVVDGVLEDDSSVMAMLGPGDPTFILFSPDGKHVVHYGFKISTRKNGFFIDGRFLPDALGGRVSNPVFTPDSRHLFWFETALSSTGAPAAVVLCVDGRIAQQVDLSDQNYDLWTKVQGAWEMDTSGTLTFIAGAGDAIKRFRVTPPTDTSIDTLLSGGSGHRGSM